MTSARSEFRFFERLRVRWAEVDMQSIVFNAHYLMYFDTAVAGYLRALAMPYHDTMAYLGGGLYAFFNAFVSSDILHWVLSGDAVLMVILGGAGTITGPIIGTGIFLMLKHVISSHTEYWMLWVGAVFIACVMFMRQGVWGLVLEHGPRWMRKRP